MHTQSAELQTQIDTLDIKLMNAAENKGALETEKPLGGTQEHGRCGNP